MSEHSPKNPPTIEGLRQTLEAVHAARGLIVGSLGREAIFRHMGLGPYREFDERSRRTGKHETLLAKSDGSPRDVDVIGPLGFARRLRGLPHFVDPAAERVRNIAQRPSGQWSHIDFHTKVHNLDPECFTPVECELEEGLTCVTVRPATHLILSRMFGKYVVGHNLLVEHMPEEELDFLQSGAYGTLWSPQLLRVVDNS